MTSADRFDYAMMAKSFPIAGCVALPRIAKGAGALAPSPSA